MQVARTMPWYECFLTCNKLHTFNTIPTLKLICTFNIRYITDVSYQLQIAPVEEWLIEWCRKYVSNSGLSLAVCWCNLRLPLKTTVLGTETVVHQQQILHIVAPHRLPGKSYCPWRKLCRVYWMCWTLQDLTAIGITKPAHRKRLKAEISKLHIHDGIPDFKPVGASSDGSQMLSGVRRGCWGMG